MQTALPSLQTLAPIAFDGELRDANGIDRPFNGATRRRWGFGPRALVTAVLAGLLAWRVDWTALGAALAGVRWGLWGLALAAYLTSQVLSAWRWAGLARGVGLKRTYWQFLKLYFEGVFFNQCLPSAIGGDVVKAVRLGTTTSERLLAGGTVLADRLSGLAVLLVLAMTGAVLERFGPPAAAIAAAIGTAMAAAGARLTVEMVGRLAAWLGGDSRFGRGLSQLAVYREQPGVLYAAIGWSFAVQSLVVLQVWLLGLALGIEATWTAYLIAAPLVSLLSTLPLTIGGIGAREAGLAGLLAPYGVAVERGVALGLLWYLVALTSGLMGGVAYVWRRRAASQLDRGV